MLPPLIVQVSVTRFLPANLGCTVPVLSTLPPAFGLAFAGLEDVEAPSLVMPPTFPVLDPPNEEVAPETGGLPSSLPVLGPPVEEVGFTLLGCPWTGLSVPVAFGGLGFGAVASSLFEPPIVRPSVSARMLAQVRQG